ncbi:MAG TPA: ATP-binding protein [Saprospiraceae bacterium]|nr:ATP-binding protein [Saprospiraceae bacterium]
MRGAASELFSTDHWFFAERILYLENVKSGEPKMSGKLILDDEWVEKLTTGKISPPALSLTFPASRLQTQLDWEDLILHPRTAAQIEDLHRWIRHSETLMDQYGLGKKLKPGFRALFHGPPGTGKTLTAMLLGKTTGHDVYRIDLSLVVSKYIGETEKNLGTLFDKARSKQWILFFDEADALFGKRTNVRDAHDKYANQEVSYLLQKIEDFPGLVILASNLKTNMDEAFTRRFQSIIYFPIPSVSERLQLWKNAFPEKMKLAKDVDIQSIAQQYELTGSAIMNIVQYACLRALDTKDKILTLQMIREGIEAELTKEGRVG